MGSNDNKIINLRKKKDVMARSYILSSNEKDFERLKKRQMSDSKKFLNQQKQTMTEDFSIPVATLW